MLLSIPSYLIDPRPIPIPTPKQIPFPPGAEILLILNTNLPDPVLITQLPNIRPVAFTPSELVPVTDDHCIRFPGLDELLDSGDGGEPLRPVIPEVDRDAVFLLESFNDPLLPAQDPDRLAGASASLHVGDDEAGAVIIH